jgi:Tfp pilus assembly protein PilF
MDAAAGFGWEAPTFSGNFDLVESSPDSSMSRSAFDVSRILDVFRFETRHERLDEDAVWFKPNGVSWQWTRPAYSLAVVGRTPRPGVPPPALPPDPVWGLRPLVLSEPGREAPDFDRLIEELRGREAPGLQYTPAGAEQMARLAPLGLRLLAVAASRGIDRETWRRLGELESLTHLILYAPLDAEALDAVARLSNLKVLALHGGAPSDEDLLRLKRLSRLEVLALPEATIGDRGLEALASLPLRTLTLSGSGTTGKGLEAIAERGRLRELEIGFSGIPEAAARSLARLRSLEYLDLNLQRWQDADPGTTLRALEGLKSLGLSWAPLGGLDWLGELGSLRRLSLHQSSLRSLAGIERASGLRELSLPDASIRDEMLPPLGRIGTLRALDLKSAPLSGLGLGDLRGLPRLTHLNLFNCVHLSDGGIDELVRFPALEELNLGSCVFPYEKEQTCGLTDRAAARLSGLRRLRHLGLAGNHVTPRTVARLRGELPDCLVESGTMALSEIVEACEEGAGATESGDLQAALAAYGRALEKDPDYPPALLGKAKALEKTGDWGRAAEAADRAVEIDGEAESFRVRGMLRARLGRSAEAVEDFTQGLRADPRRAELLIWRAEAKLDAKDFAGASADFTRWIERCSGPEEQDRQWVGWLAHVLLNRAYARLESGDAAGAEADSSLMVELAPGNADALLCRAEAREKLGREADARSDYAAVLNLEPGNADARKRLDELG